MRSVERQYGGWAHGYWIARCTLCCVQLGLHGEPEVYAAVNLALGREVADRVAKAAVAAIRALPEGE